VLQCSAGSNGFQCRVEACVLQWVAVCCSAVQCVIFSRVLQCVAVCCSVLQ